MNKKMIFSIPEDLYREVKMTAFDRNEPMRKWVIRAFLAALAKEKQYKNEEKDDK